MEQIIRCCAMSIPIKSRIVQTMVFPVTFYERQNWILNKQDRKSSDVFELWCWRSLLGILLVGKKTNKWNKSTQSSHLRHKWPDLSYHTLDTISRTYHSGEECNAGRGEGKRRKKRKEAASHSVTLVMDTKPEGLY